MYVYFIRQGLNGPIKIGKAKDIDRRLAELQVGNPKELRVVAQLPCESDKHAFAVEAKIHRLFAKQHMRGEWYNGNIKMYKILLEGYSIQK